MPIHGGDEGGEGSLKIKRGGSGGKSGEPPKKSAAYRMEALGKAGVKRFTDTYRMGGAQASLERAPPNATGRSGREWFFRKIHEGGQAGQT